MSDLPPIQFELPPVAEVKKPGAELPRVWLGWALLAVIFAALIGNSFVAASGKRILSGKDTDKAQTKMVEMMLGLKALQGKNAPKTDVFTPYIDDLKNAAKKSADAQKLRVALRTEDDKAPFGDDLKNLAASQDEQNQIFAKLYETKEIKKAEAEPLLVKLDGKDLGEKLALVQFKEKFGDKEIRGKSFPAEPAIRFGIAGMIGCTGFLAGVVLLGMFTTQRAAGAMKPMGMPQQGVSLPVADRLALGAAIIMCSYLGLGLVAAKWLSGIPAVQQVLPFVGILVSIGLISQVSMMGHRFTLTSLGISTNGFGKRILWGIGAYLALLPILLVALFVVSALAKVLPGNAHPVGEEVLNANGIQALGLFVMASVIAPIWEEIMFRGLLFPALSAITKSPVWGAVISSFVFAAIHPQGPAGIPLLMTLALGMCFVSYQTKSLVPNIIMHAMNNSGALFMLLLIGKDLF
ncbi:MAG: type II CAAX endopeptidase family protein [Armatimonadota bacterium]